MSETFQTYTQGGFLDFESHCKTDPTPELLKKEKFRGKVLDVASGHAPYLLSLSGYDELTLLDRSGMLLKAAKEKAEKNKLRNIKYVESQSEKMPFEDNTFDMILCSFALCDVHDWQDTLKEIERVIKPDGELILIDCIGGNNDFLYDIVQTADVIEGTNIGRESPEIWAYLIKYTHEKADLLEYKTYKIVYKFTTPDDAVKATEGMETRMKDNNVKDAIRKYMETRDGKYEADALYLKLRIKKT